MKIVNLVLALVLVSLMPLALARLGEDDLAVEEHNDLEALQEHHDEMHSGNWGYGMGSMMGYNFFGLGWLGMLLWWALWLVVAGAIVYLLLRLLQGNRADARELSLDVLKRRFAGGELTKKQFEEMKKTLKK